MQCEDFHTLRSFSLFLYIRYVYMVFFAGTRNDITNQICSAIYLVGYASKKQKKHSHTKKVHTENEMWLIKCEWFLFRMGFYALVFFSVHTVFQWPYNKENPIFLLNELRIL